MSNSILKTKRAILFEQIHPYKAGLLERIDDSLSKVSLSDVEIQDIHRELFVNSYDEFIQKFMPVVYIKHNYTSKSFDASLIKNDLGNVSQGIVEEYFLTGPAGILQYLPQVCESEDQRNFIYSCHLSNGLMNNENQEVLLRLRKNLIDNINIGNMQNIGILFSKIVENSQDSLGVMRLFVEDANRYLHRTKGEEIKPLIVSDIDSTQLRILSISEEFLHREALLTEEKADDYIKVVDALLGGYEIYNRQMLRNLLLIPCMNMSAWQESLYLEYQSAIRFYERAVRILWYRCRPYIETAMRVHLFFEKYAGQKGNSASGLIVANCDPDSMSNRNNRNKLKLYLETVNNKIDTGEVISYSMLPQIPEDEKRKPKLRRSRFQSSGGHMPSKEYDIENIQVLTNILEEYNIKTLKLEGWHDRTKNTVIC